MNFEKIIVESLDENKELHFWIKFFVVFFVLFNIFGMLVSKDKWDDFYDLINSILVNILAAFMFYVLVVYIPEKKAKKVRKKNFKIIFEITKLAILEVLLKALDDKSKPNIEELLTPNNFKNFFNDSKWKNIESNLKENTYLVNEIITELEILKSETFYILNKLETYDKQIYNFLKYLSIIIHNYKSVPSQEVNIHGLSEFLEKLFTNYNWTKKESSKENIFEDIVKQI